MRDFRRDWDGAVARAAFACAECGNVAARVALVLDEPATPAAAGEGRSGLVGESGFFGEWAQVVLGPGLPPVARALAAADASALYEVEPLWAPFYCPECRLCFCHRHWAMRVVFDDEWTSWYDYTEATCPKGHQRIVDD